MKKFFSTLLFSSLLAVFTAGIFSCVKAWPAIPIDSILHANSSILDNFPDSALTIARECYRNGDSNDKLKSLLVIGKVNLINGNYLEAQQSLQEGLLLLKPLDVQKIHGDYYLAVGKLFNMKRRYDESLNYYQMAILAYEQLQLTDEVAFTKLGIVELYRKLKEYGKAEKLLSEISMQIQPATPDYVWAEYYNRRAAVFNEKRTSGAVISYMDSSLKYTLLALEVAERIDNRHLIATSLNELGYNYENRQNLNSAYSYYARAEKIWDELKYQRYSCHVKNNLGRILFKRKEFLMSNQKIVEQLPLTEKNDWKDIMVYAYYYLASNYEQLNDYRHAAEFWKKYAEQSILILEEEKSNEIREAEVKYQLKEKERVLAGRNEKKEIKYIKASYFAGILLTFFVIIALFLKRRKLLAYLSR